MKKTTNYQLNQWEVTDKLSRADFNRDNAAIDAALAAKAEKSAVTAVETALANYKTSNDAAVAAKAAVSTVTALQQSVTETAAKADAAYSANNPGFEFVTVDTTGKGNGETVYTFAKAPKFVIIQGSCSCAMVKSSSTAVMVDKVVPTLSSGVEFKLSGTSLILLARNDSTLALSLTILVHY